MKPPPELAERYEIVGLLGRGGMGSVFRARDHELGRDVALKLVQQGGGDGLRRKRFEREGQVAANLRHPGIVQVHSAGYAGGRPYLAYELVEGARALDEAAADLDLRARVILVRDAARALGHAHREGVVHRDVKPANVLVDQSGRVRVTDFGLAAAHGLERLTETGAVVGTPSYLAPEQATGEKSTAATDVWALGVVLYEVLSGELPFSASTIVELIGLIIRGKPAPLRQRAPAVPAPLEAICARALSQEPLARYPDGDGFADALDAWLGGESAGSLRGRTLAWVAGVAALALLGLGAAGLSGETGEHVVSRPTPQPPSEDEGPPATANPSPAGEQTPSPLPLPGQDQPTGLTHVRTLRVPVDEEGTLKAVFLGDDVLCADGEHSGPFSLTLLHRGGGPLGAWTPQHDASGLVVLDPDTVLLPYRGWFPILRRMQSGQRLELVDLPRVDQPVACALTFEGGDHAIAYFTAGAIVLARLSGDLQRVLSQATFPWPGDQAGRALGLDPSARTLVAVGANHPKSEGLVAIWSTEQRKRVGFCRLSPVYALDIHPTQARFVVGTRTSQIFEFSLDSRGEMEPTSSAFIDHTLEHSPLLRRMAHGGYVAQVVYSSDGAHLFSTGASSSTRNRNEVALWRVADGKLLARQRLERVPTSLSLSGDGRHLVVGTRDGVAELFKTSER